MFRDPKVLAAAESTYATSWQEKVGPPGAEIAVAVVNPAKYGFVSTFERKLSADGKNVQFKFDSHWDVAKQPEEPALSPKGTLVLLHGITMLKEAMHPWALYFAQQGYRVVLVDLRGHGRSTGSWISYGAWDVDDLRKVIDELQRRQLLVGKLGVFGVSYGGSIALQWAAQDRRIATVMALAPFADAQVAIPEFARGIAPQKANALSATTFARAEVKAAKMAGFSWEKVNVVEALKQTRVPVLLFHGEHDTWVPPRHTELLAAVAPAGSRREVTPDDDHISLPMRLDVIGPAALAWFDEKLATESTPTTSVSASAP